MDNVGSIWWVAPAGCDLDSREVFRLFFHQTWVKKPGKFDYGSNVWSLPAEVTHEALHYRDNVGSIWWVAPAGCDLDSREVFRLFFFIRLGLRNLASLTKAQTFGHFRQ